MSLTSKPFGASKLVSLVWGVFAGFGGIWHGIGEVLQGNVSQGSIFIYSWTTGPIATNMGGEPGFSLIPNMLVTGIFAIVISAIIILWTIGFVRRKNGGRILILLSVIMLLVGGGVGPPVVGIIAGWAGTGINSPMKWWRKRFSGRMGIALSQSWIWLFTICLVATFILFIGSIFLVYFLDVNNAALFTNLFYLIVISEILTVIAGFATDIIQSESPQIVEKAVI